MSRVAVIGLGEAGRIYAAALHEAGHQVIGFDPVRTEPLTGVSLADSAAEAAGEAEVVLVFTGALASPPVARECLPALRPGALYVDLTSSAPETMAELAELAPADSFVDAAILGPVIAQRAQTPLIVSGARSAEAAELLSGLGAKVTDVAGRPGSATSHKLVRSVAGKGLAAVVCETMAAARAAGIDEWMRDQLAALLPGDGYAVIDRYESGTRKHAMRRAHEMDEVVAYLTNLGVDCEMSQATAQLHHRYADEEVAS